MLKGKQCPKLAGTIKDSWDKKCAGDLNSAICGGQWAQARKAAVTDWGITDNRCQLCFGAVGTLGHRFECPSTMPEGGWPKPSAISSMALLALSKTRQDILRNHGLLAIRLPPARYAQQGEFRWLVEPDMNDPKTDQATWYCDGSMLQGKWQRSESRGSALRLCHRKATC